MAIRAPNVGGLLQAYGQYQQAQVGLAAKKARKRAQEIAQEGQTLRQVGTVAGAVIGGYAAGATTGGMGAPAGAMLGASIGNAAGGVVAGNATAGEVIQAGASYQNQKQIGQKEEFNKAANTQIVAPKVDEINSQYKTLHAENTALFNKEDLTPAETDKYYANQEKMQQLESRKGLLGKFGNSTQDPTKTAGILQALSQKIVTRLPTGEMVQMDSYSGETKVLSKAPTSAWGTSKSGVIKTETGQIKPAFAQQNKNTGEWRVDGQPLAQEATFVPKPTQETAEEFYDGKGNLIYKKSKGGKVGAAVKNKVQNSLAEGYTQLVNLKKIQSLKKDKYLTIEGALNKYVRKGKSFLKPILPKGMQLTAEQSKELKEYSAFRSSSLRSLSQYMKSISGVAISEPEAKRLKESFPNPSMTPEEFDAAMEGTIAEIASRTRIYNEISEEGFKGDLVKEIDRRISEGIEADPRKRYNVLKSNKKFANDGEAIILQLRAEGFNL